MDQWGCSCSQYCWWSDRTEHLQPLLWALRVLYHRNPESKFKNELKTDTVKHIVWKTLHLCLKGFFGGTIITKKSHFTIHAISFVEILQWALTYLFGFIMSHSMFRNERCTCVIVLQTWYHFLWAKGHQTKRPHSETTDTDLHINSAIDRRKRTPNNFKYVNNKSV